MLFPRYSPLDALQVLTKKHLPSKLKPSHSAAYCGLLLIALLIGMLRSLFQAPSVNLVRLCFSLNFSLHCVRSTAHRCQWTMLHNARPPRSSTGPRNFASFTAIAPQSRRSLRISAATWPSDSFNWLISNDRVLPTRFHWT